MKKKLCFAGIAVIIIILLLTGTLVACHKSQYTAAKEFAETAEYIIKTKEDPNSVMQEVYDEGYGPLKSFYLGYDFENPKNSPVTYGFHSELRNEKGAVLAEYEPFLILKGKTADNTDDYRIILFDEEYTMVSKDASGTEERDEDLYSFEIMGYSCSQALEADGCDPAQGKPLEIYGTCDDTFIYVEKMVWYHVDFDIVYTYTTKKDVNQKGKVSVDSWLNTLKDKKFIMQTENLPGTYNGDAKLDKQAKELCKELSEAYLKAGCDSAKLANRNDKNDLEKYTIEKVEDLGDGYFVSSVYVLHPMEQALPVNHPVWWLVLCAWLVGIAGIYLLYKKSTEKDDEKSTAQKAVEN